MKKLLTCLLSLSLVFGAPGLEAAGKRHGKTTKTHATVHKTKKASATKRGKLPATKKQKRVRVAAHAHRPQQVSRRDTALRMSPQLGALQVEDEAVDGPALRSSAALVVDQKTGEFLYAKNPDMATPIASITKLMTSMVVLDAGLPMSEPVSVGPDDVDRLKYSSSRLAVGATLSRGDLLHLALIASENRAAAALSRAYPGGRPAFVQAMNDKAAELGMRHTWFVDSTGLSSENRSTAADLARLVEAAYAYPRIREISSTGQYGVSVPGYKVVRVRENGKVRRVTREVTRRIAVHNTNALTRNPQWEIGISKTGFINEAGHCLVMQARIDGRKVIMVLLDSAGKMSRIGDATRVRKWLERSALGGGRIASQATPQPAG